jgi:hypothetical protein
MKNASNDAIFLNIVGFIIKISFYPTEWVYLKNKVKREIINQYQDFIEENFSEKANYQIDIKEKFFLNIIFRKKEKNYFLNFYQQINKNKIETYYQISLIQFQLIIRNVLQELLSKNKGFILHASGNVIDGKAYLFLAPSGGGKSTIMTMLSDKYKPIASDTAIIKKEKKGYFIYQTPFLEKDSWVKKDKIKYPLGKIFFLKKANFFKIEKIEDKKEILNLALKQFWADKESFKIKYLIQFIQKNSFYILNFRKNKNEIKKLIIKFEKLF